MAAALIGDVANYLKLTKEVTKDNVVFRIVTAGSFGVLMLSAGLAGLTTFFGEPIVCKNKEGNPLIEPYCWIHGTRIAPTDDNENCLDDGDADVSFDRKWCFFFEFLNIVQFCPILSIFSYFLSACSILSYFSFVQIFDFVLHFFLSYFSIHEF